MDEVTAKNIIETLLFIASKPLSVDDLYETLEGKVERRAIKAAAAKLMDEYSQRALQVIEVAGGYQLCTRPQYGGWVRSFLRAAKRQKLSKQAIETLALVVYRQPITKVEVEALRGVDAGGAIKTLLQKRLIKIVGRKRAPGRPIIYGSTREFLQYFGIKDLSELPLLSEIEGGE